MTETMTAPVEAPRRVRPWEVPGDSDRGWDLFRLVLLVVYVGLWLATLVTGTLQASYDRLNADLRLGEARSVQLVIDGFDQPAPRGDFREHRSVVWQDGLLRRQATLVWVDSGPERTLPNGNRVVRTEPGAWLAERYGVPVDRVEASSQQQFRAWRGGPFFYFGDLLGLAHVSALIFLFVFLVMSPQPWRATRWAWFWMVFVSPLAMLAFLTFGGRTPGIRPPADPRRRINGWWGFLIGLVLPGITAGLATSASGFLDSLYF